MKGKLIYKGFLVHEIDKKISSEKFKILGNISKNPIKASDLKKIEGYIKDQKTDLFYLRGIKDKTINLSVMLDNNDYRQLIGLPENIRIIIEKYRNIRNSLHLKPISGASYNQQVVNEIKDLIRFVNGRMIKQYNRLIKKIKPTEYQSFLKKEIPF